MPANGAFASVVMPLLRRFSWVQSVAHDPCGSAAAGRKLVVAKRLRANEAENRKVRGIRDQTAQQLQDSRTGKMVFRR